MTMQHVSLGDFIKQLTLRFDAERITMPLRDEKPWHILFYKLKKSEAPAAKPSFFQELLFDWDGPYPRSPELADYIHALHWTGCLTASNPQYDKVALNEKVSEIWKSVVLDEEVAQFVNFAVELAKKEFAVQ